jgi:hypothetical protein
MEGGVWRWSHSAGGCGSCSVSRLLLMSIRTYTQLGLDSKFHQPTVFLILATSLMLEPSVFCSFNLNKSIPCHQDTREAGSMS